MTGAVEAESPAACLFINRDDITTMSGYLQSTEMGQMHGSRLITRAISRIAAAAGIVGAVTGGVVLGAAPTAVAASTSPYEVYCPGTPVGTVVINNVVTSGIISPSTLAAGSTFDVTDFHTVLDIPEQLVAAAKDLGDTSLHGSATAALDASGATPASLNTPTLEIDTPIPGTIPSTGLALTVLSPGVSVGPFIATGGAITISVASKESLSIVTEALTLSCTAYPNEDIATSTGLTTATPSGSAVTPQLATATTTPPTTSGLADTGGGPGLRLLAELGVGSLVLAGLVTVGDRARTALASGGRRRRRGRQDADDGPLPPWRPPNAGQDGHF